MLHIGDIHYNHIDKDDRPVDRKDLQFPESLNEILPEKSYQTIIKSFMYAIGEPPLAILLSGDLSTYGKIDGYKDCLRFLKKRIPANFFDSEPFQKLFIVPGNHDIDRKKVSDDSLYCKFKPIQESLEEEKFPEVPVPDLKTEKLCQDPSCSVLVISINSCIGCGERRYYPEKIRDAISKSLDCNEEENMELCYEMIDTPVIKDEDIGKMVHCIQSDENILPIILTHHNLLPQKRPRIAMYTELLNSGYIREKLLMLNRPIIYLHGHLHDDPIEIIQSPRYEKAKIICISAPLLFPNTKDETKKFGFNKIKIICGEHEVPIGCEITYHRPTEANVDKKEERIRFLGPPDTIALATPEDKDILRCINENMSNVNMYLSDLRGKVNEEYGKNLSIGEIEESVDRLSWLGLVDYKRRDNKIPMRCVLKVVP